MNRRKLGSCLTAGLITLAGATYLAAPVAASTVAADCSEYQQGYAQGWVDATCGGSGGTVYSCNSNGDGSITITYRC